MKWLMLLACWVVVGCGLIFGIVNGIVPHLLAPDMFPKAQAREVPPAPLESAIADAGCAVHGGVETKPDAVAAR